MKPQIWQTLLCCFAAAMFLMLGVLAADIVDSGTCGAEGDNLTWTLDSDGVLTISGTGEMDNWGWTEDGETYNVAPWDTNSDNIITVIINGGITAIGNHAFSDCTNLTSITIPDSVISIGRGTFFDCDNLQNVIIGNNVTIIGDDIFFRCNSLTSITIPDSVTAIGEQAFYYCKSLTNVIIGNGVTIIGYEAFCGCDNLISMTFGHNLTTIGTYAFNGCDSLTDVTIPSNVTFIGLAAFGYCDSLKNVIIGNGTTTIGSYAFAGCVSLTKVKIGDGATTIRSSAFLDCQNLKNVTIPRSVTKIESGAFKGCLDVVLCVYENSYAHTYAVENDLTYEFISNEVGTVRAGTAKAVSVMTETYDVTLDCSDANISMGVAYRVLYALCDEHGQLLSIGSVDVTFDTGTSAYFTIEGVEEGLTCRIFLLNDKTSPQCAATQLTFVG